jgi:signal transduction histidine kinase
VERVGRVIENLLTNAIKYSPDGGPVAISALEEHGLAVLRVADSGIGVPAFDHDRLFELGYRTDKAATVASGLGLGLYIAAAIVRRHGGTLEAARRESGGSVFTVRLPLVGSRHASVVDPAPRGPHGSPYPYAS